MELYDINQIKFLLSQHGFNFSKALGQNFLINPEVCPKMAEMCFEGNDDFGVIEIGPGIGVLTKELCKKAKKVVAIELDKRLLPILDKTLKEFDNVEIISGDAMKLDLKKLIEEKFKGLKVAVCANLPYYITSPIIMGLLEKRLPLDNITVMVQKEAADRLCAAPGERECGAVSAAVSYYSKPEILFSVDRESFIPAPKVDSSVIRLKIRESAPINPKDEELFFRCVKAAFAQRRKTVLNSLSSALSLNKQELSDVLSRNGISPTLRAEALSMDKLNRLCDAVFELTH